MTSAHPVAPPRDAKQSASDAKAVTKPLAADQIRAQLDQAKAERRQLIKDIEESPDRERLRRDPTLLQRQDALWDRISALQRQLDRSPATAVIPALEPKVPDPAPPNPLAALEKELKAALRDVHIGKKGAPEKLAEIEQQMAEARGFRRRERLLAEALAEEEAKAKVLAAEEAAALDALALQAVRDEAEQVWGRLERLAEETATVASAYCSLAAEVGDPTALRRSKELLRQALLRQPGVWGQRIARDITR